MIDAMFYVAVFVGFVKNADHAEFDAYSDRYVASIVIDTGVLLSDLGYVRESRRCGRRQKWEGDVGYGMIL